LLALCSIASAQKAAYNGTLIDNRSYLKTGGIAKNQLLDPSLLLYYPLAIPADAAYDASGNNRTGVYSGSVSGFSGAGNHAWFMGCPYCGKTGPAAPYFNHAHPNIITTPAFVVPASAFTLSAWVSPNNGIAQYARIIESWNTYAAGYYLGVDATATKFYGMVNASTLPSCLTSTAAFSKGTSTWYLVTLTYDGTAGRLYVNGAIATTAASCPFTAPTTTPSQVNVIGCGVTTCSASYGGWDGSIQEVRIYNRVLSAAEIAALYTAQNH
jgi:hypothetical protein